ncbi:cytochrome P450 [Mycena polygramma]|nr:cytochrome P450 [Mycena polygramma]
MSSFDIPSMICAIALGLIFYGLYWQRTRSKLPLPPGPRKLPLVGNLFQIPSVQPWKKYMAWSKEYNSDVLHLDIAGTSLVVLSSLEATEALFIKRSSIYSDRRTHRLVKRVTRHTPYRFERNNTVLQNLLQAPDAFMNHFRHWAGQNILSIAYGIDVQPVDDPYVALAHETLHILSEASPPGKYVVDSFPILKHIPEWFPGAGFKRQAKEWRKLAHAMRDVPFAETKRQMDLGIAPSSFTANSLAALSCSEDLYFTENTLRAAAGTMYVGGADTTVAALSTFVLAMLANPVAQRKAQAEIDAVTGGKGLPDFTNEQELPYLSAVVKEVLRWRNVGPIGVPHYIAVEDEYKGYRIPAGSIVIGNAWAILHDEALYPDPYTFNPERFLLNGKSNANVQNPEAAFGFGRRECPGRHMATAGLWIAIASILATFDITKPLDEEGQVIEPSFEYDSGFINFPLPFRCSIRPRSLHAVELINEALVHA